MHFSLALVLGIIAFATTTGRGLAAESDPGRIAVIDASERTDEHLTALKQAGVLVIGRYFGRCFQWPGKRIVDNEDELKAILDKGFALLSIYQYDSSNRLKFNGRSKRTYLKQYNDDSDGREAAGKRDAECPLDKWPAAAVTAGKLEIEVSQRDRSCTPPVVRDCLGVDASHTGAVEAELDADAALDQAAQIDQPSGSAIYFGVDFDVVLEKEPTLKQHLIEYFTVVSNKLRAHARSYLVGAYGNGAALELLKRTTVADGPFKGKPLIDLAWFNASPGPDRTAAVYNGDGIDVHARFDWDLYQTRVGIDYPASGAGMVVDLDVQNKKNAGKYIGFWNRAGHYKVPASRTKAIFDQRRFACNGMALIRSRPSGDAASGKFCGRKSEDKREPILDCNGDQISQPSRICFGALTRVGQARGGFVKVDCDEDGTFEGWTASDNLGLSMAKRPLWIDDNERRPRATREDTVCER